MTTSDSTFDLILVGTGFGSTFFLLKYLQLAPPPSRVLVLERGHPHSLEWRIENQRMSDVEAQDLLEYADPSHFKRWTFNIGFGGSSMDWGGNLHRMHPSDFRGRSLYGVGLDWPLAYEDIEPFYCEAEDVMQVSGPPDAGHVWPRSRPYPLPPHRFSVPEAKLKEAYPDEFFAHPSAKSPVPLETRAMCCSTGRCGHCPVDAKFMVPNDAAQVYADPRVELRFGAEVAALETDASAVTAIRYLAEIEGTVREGKASADLVVLGANSIMNPYLLLRSGIDDGPVGQYLTEQGGYYVEILLDGMESFQGSTMIPGLGMHFYDGPSRQRAAGCFFETWNQTRYRPEPRRFREVMNVGVMLEDIPQAHNRVSVDPAHPERPRVEFSGFHEYLVRGRTRVDAELGDYLGVLPIEEVRLPEGFNPSHGHIIGTTRMGENAEDSVVDRNLLHHRYRNLVVTGGGAFPTCPPALPTLTIAALSLASATALLGNTRHA
jgi:choline dehydrogenase-like flavoprotein